MPNHRVKPILSLLLNWFTRRAYDKALLMELKKKIFSTSDLMKTFELGRNTLRLYEEKGLLTCLKRSDAKYRQYSPEHIRDLKFILEAKNNGFSLAEIKSLLDLFKRQQKLTCGSVSEEIVQKISEIKTQVEILNQKKDFLGQFLQTCQSKGSSNTCDVISTGFSKKACCD